MRIKTLLAIVALLSTVFVISPVFAQRIGQSRGVDSRVDYASLVRFGPWDDRNYDLTEEDLALLAPNEEEISEGIPAFYRVHLRKTRPAMLRSGPVQYPRSALPMFRLQYGGYLVDGEIYTKLVRRNGRSVVDLSEGVEERNFRAMQALQGEARVTSPNGAAESAIAFHPSNTDIVIAGSNGPGSGQKMHYSDDGGSTWSAAAALPLGGTCCDPTVAWSSDGTKAYTATLGSGVWFYRSSDNGATWNDLGADPRRELGSNVDKEYLDVDHSPTSPHLDNIYLTWHENNTMIFARSTDRGDTWSSPLTVSSGSNEQGIGSDIATDTAGNVYYFWPAFNSQKILVRKSTNGGSSFHSTVDVASTEGSFTFPIPSIESREVFLYVSADSDRSSGPNAGSIYVAWTDSTAATGGSASGNHARIQVAYSRDGGGTWSISTPHETADAGTVDRWHQWLSVGSDGTVHVIFYDTRRSGTSRNAVDLFYSSSSDGAQTWSAPIRLTSAMSSNISDGFEFGDYNGMDVILNDLIAVFTDNRNEGGGGGDSVDVYAAGTAVGSGNAAPVVSITAPANGSQFPSGTSISFAGTATDAEDGDLTANLAWSSSLDGTIGTGGSFSAVLSDGTHQVTASVTDSGSRQGSSAIAITVEAAGGNTAPQVTISSPANASSFSSGTSIAFAGTATDTEDGSLTPNLSWNSDLDGTIGTGGSFSVVLSDGTHTITASVTDSGGQTGSSQILVTITIGCETGGLSEAFEGGAPGWTTTGLWHLASHSGCASPGYSSPVSSMYYGQDAFCDFDTGDRTTGDLVSPPIQDIDSSSVLSFDFFREVEYEPAFSVDKTVVAVSVEGSGNWTIVWSRDSTDTSLAAWAESGPISLAAWDGQAIRLRFRFDSDDELFNEHVGWMVDDVVVTGSCSSGGGSIFEDGFESGDLSRWSLP